MHTHHLRGWLVLESVSVSYGKATPYFPVLDLLRRYCHLDDTDDSRTVQARVTRQILMLDAALQDTLPALLALLDALPADSPFRRLDPPQRRQQTLEALKRVLLRESQVQPLLLVCEDLHWIDDGQDGDRDCTDGSLPTQYRTAPGKMVYPAVGAGIEQRHMLSLQISCDIWSLVGIAAFAA